MFLAKWVGWKKVEALEARVRENGEKRVCTVHWITDKFSYWCYSMYYIHVETMCNTIVIHREFHKYRFSMFLYTLNPTTTLTTSLFINSFRILCNVPCVYMCIYIAVHPELVYKLNEAGTSTCISHQWNTREIEYRMYITINLRNFRLLPLSTSMILHP